MTSLPGEASGSSLAYCNCGKKILTIRTFTTSPLSGVEKFTNRLYLCKVEQICPKDLVSLITTIIMVRWRGKDSCWSFLFLSLSGVTNILSRRKFMRRKKIIKWGTLIDMISISQNWDYTKSMKESDEKMILRSWKRESWRTTPFFESILASLRITLK